MEDDQTAASTSSAFFEQASFGNNGVADQRAIIMEHHGGL
jgi:hypothetical protein